tara:strand:+ start:3165 stop:3800 length:636 start_codon:yes stop_codon:yes gene_type:complete
MSIDLLLTLISYAAFFFYIFILNKKSNEQREVITHLSLLSSQVTLEIEDIKELNLELKREQNDRIQKNELLKEKLKALNEKVRYIQKEHAVEMKKEVKAAREDSLKRSRSVIRGQASEHLAPFVIPETNPKDYRFMGNPIDYVCFDGLSDVLDGQSDKIKSIRIIDIKTGKSSLNKSQRRIRNAITEGKVTFEIINLDEKLESKTIKSKKA